MQWIKDHLHIVICGVIASAAVAFIVLGWLDGEARADMEDDISQVSGLRSVSPVNKTFVDQARMKFEQSEAEVRKKEAEVQEVGERTVLIDGAFPERQRAAIPLNFKRAYDLELKKFAKTLNAKDEPSSEEIGDMQTQMDDAKKKAAADRQFGLGNQPKSKVGQPGFAPGKNLPKPPLGPGRPGGPAGQAKKLAEMTPEELVQADPEARISVLRAHEIYCYAGPDSFDRREDILGVPMPTLGDMWYAQMSLWVQDDLVKALAGVNEAAAAKIVEQDPEAKPWVGVLPVKRIVAIAIGGYVGPAGGGGLGGLGGGRGGRPAAAAKSSAGDPSLVFTQRGGTDSVDVIHLSIQLVVEARMLPTIIDAISEAGFYTPLLVNYQAISPNPGWIGFIYGSDPAIEVTILWEGAFLRAKYDAWMPQEVKDAIPAGVAVSSDGGSGDLAPGGAQFSSGGRGGGRAPTGRMGRPAPLGGGRMLEGPIRPGASRHGTSRHGSGSK